MNNTNHTKRRHSHRICSPTASHLIRFNNLVVIIVVLLGTTTTRHHFIVTGSGTYHEDSTVSDGYMESGSYDAKQTRSRRLKHRNRKEQVDVRKEANESNDNKYWNRLLSSGGVFRIPRSTSSNKHKKVDTIHSPDGLQDKLEDLKDELETLKVYDDPNVEGSINNSNNTVLTAVVHIGPQKTGTSAIQVSMNRYLLPSLFEDGYERVPDVNVIAARSFAGCFALKTQPRSVTLSNEFRTTTTTTSTGITSQINHDHERQRRNTHVLDYDCHEDTLLNPIPIATKDHMNLIVSSESLANKHVDIVALKSYLQQYWQNVVVVAYYRRFYSWIVSLHNQQNKGKSLHDTNALHDFLNRREFLETTVYDGYYIVGAIRRYRQHFDETALQIYNIHELGTEDVTEHFFCKAIHKANKTCTTIQEHTRNLAAATYTQNTAVNGAIHLVYKNLAYHAIELQYLPHTVNVTHLISVVQQRQEQTLNLTSIDFDETFILCPTPETLEWLFERSLEAEYELFPKKVNKSSINETLRDDFEIYKHKKAFCHIDARSILTNGDTNHWREYFQSLEL